METTELIKELLNKTKLAVISTVGNPAPESAVLEFGNSEELELVFDTFISSRKYKNLQDNNNVSFVIGWDNNITVQYEGVAEEIVGEEAKKNKQIYWEKNPEAKRWAKTEGITYFRVKPKWIRYSDLNKDPWAVQELTF